MNFLARLLALLVALTLTISGCSNDREGTVELAPILGTYIADLKDTTLYFFDTKVPLFISIAGKDSNLVVQFKERDDDSMALCVLLKDVSFEDVKKSKPSKVQVFGQVTNLGQIDSINNLVKLVIDPTTKSAEISVNAEGTIHKLLANSKNKTSLSNSFDDILSDCGGGNHTVDNLPPPSLPDIPVDDTLDPDQILNTDKDSDVPLIKE